MKDKIKIGFVLIILSVTAIAVFAVPLAVYFKLISKSWLILYVASLGWAIGNMIWEIIAPVWLARAVAKLFALWPHYIFAIAPACALGFLTMKVGNESLAPYATIFGYGAYFAVFIIIKIQSEK